MVVTGTLRQSVGFPGATDNLPRTKQNTTKPCAYFMGYTVSINLVIGHVKLVAITGTIILVPYLYIKSLQLICRSGSHRFHLWGPDLQWLDYMIGYQENSTSNGHQVDMPHCFRCRHTWQTMILLVLLHTNATNMTNEIGLYRGTFKSRMKFTQ